MFTCTATEKLKKGNLVIFPGVGAVEQLSGPGRGVVGGGEFEQKFLKNSNAQGAARGGGGDVEGSI